MEKTDIWKNVYQFLFYEKQKTRNTNQNNKQIINKMSKESVKTIDNKVMKISDILNGVISSKKYLCIECSCPVEFVKEHTRTHTYKNKNTGDITTNTITIRPHFKHKVPKECVDEKILCCENYEKFDGKKTNKKIENKK